MVDNAGFNPFLQQLNNKWNVTLDPNNAGGLTNTQLDPGMSMNESCLTPDAMAKSDAGYLAAQMQNTQETEQQQAPPTVEIPVSQALQEANLLRLNDKGNVTGVNTNPLSNDLQTILDNNIGNATSVTYAPDANGNIVTEYYTHDSTPRHLATTTQLSGGGLSAIVYQAVGVEMKPAKAVVIEDGVHTTNIYDAGGNNIIETTVIENYATTVTKFDGENIISNVRTSGNNYTANLDAQGRPINETIDLGTFTLSKEYNYNPDGSYSVTTSGDVVHRGLANKNGVQNFDSHGNLISSFDANGNRAINEALSEGLVNGKVRATLNGKGGEISSDGYASTISVKNGVSYSADGLPTSINVKIPQGTTELTYISDGKYTNNAKDLTYQMHSDANGNLSIETAKGAQRDANLEKYAEKKRQEEEKLKAEQEAQNAEKIQANLKQIEQEKEAQQKHISAMERKGSDNAQKLFNIMDGLNCNGEKERNEIFSALKKMTPEEMAYTVLAFRGQNSGKESMMECILDEAAMTNGGSLNNQYGTQAMKIIGGKLAQFAESQGIDVKEFNKKLNYISDYSVLSNRHNVKDFDALFEGMAKAVTTRNSLTPTQLASINNMSSQEAMEMSKKVNASTIQTAQGSYDDYKLHEGWTGTVADGISSIWGSKNRAKVVEPALAQAKKIEQTLGAITDPVKYASEFQRIYQVPFDPVAIATYQEIRNDFEQAAESYLMEKSFADNCSYLLHGASALMDETKESYTGDVPITTIMRTKEMVFSDEKSNLIKMLGPSGEVLLNERIKAAGLDPTKATPEQIYPVMCSYARDINKQLHNETMKATHGVSIENYKKQCDSAYYTAFGNKADALKIANDYISSQRVGEQVVKGTTKAIVAIGTSLIPGVGPIAAAAITTASNMTIDVTDQLLTEDFFDKLDSGQDFLTAAKETLPPEEFGQIVKSAFVDGALTVTGAKYAQFFKGLNCNSLLKAMGQSSANVATATLADAVVNGGEINIDGVLVRLAFSAAGTIIGYKIMPNGNVMRPITQKTVSKSGGIVANSSLDNIPDAELDNFLNTINPTPHKK